MERQFVGFDTPAPGKTIRVKSRKTQTATAVDSLSQQLSLTAAASGPTISSLLRADTNEREVAAVAEAQKPSFGEAFGAAVQSQGLTGAAIRILARGTYEPKPGFVVPEAALDGYDEEEREFLLGARSPEELAAYRTELQIDRDNARTLGARGAGWAVAVSVLAGMPEGFLTGGLITKAMYARGLGSLQAAQAGQRGRAVRLAVAENVGGNLALAGLEDALVGRMSVYDYGINAVTGLAAAGLNVPGINAQALRGLEERTVLASLEKQAILFQRARANLGEGADDAAIKAEMQRLETEQLRQDTKAYSAPASTDRRFMPDLEKLEAEEAGAAPRTQDESAIVSAETGMTQSWMTNSPGQDQPVLAIDTQVIPGGFDTARELDREWAQDLLDQPVSWQDGKVESRWQRVFREYGLDLREARSRPTGASYEGAMWEDGDLRATADWLTKNFLNDQRVVFVAGDQLKPGTRGDAWYTGENTSLIRLRPGMPPALSQQVLVHEIGHIVLKTQAERVSSRVLDGFKQMHTEWLETYTGTDRMGAALQRGAVSSTYTDDAFKAKDPQGFRASMMDVMAGVVSRVDDQLRKTNTESLKFATKYIPNADEFGAENFAKYIEAAVMDALDWKPKSIPAAVVYWFRDAVSKVLKLFNLAKERNLVAPDARVVDFFEAIRKANRASATKAKRAEAGMVVTDRDYGPRAPKGPAASGELPDVSWLQDPVAVKYGIDSMPVETPAQRAEAKAVLEMYRRAEDPTAPWNNIDQKYIDSITSNSTFDVASTSLTMLKSQNPLVRMAAAELVESPTGATGRRSTAAIAKYMNERAYMGNALNDFNAAYTEWRTSVGGGIAEDILKGDNYRRFNRMVAEEIEARRVGDSANHPPAVLKAVVAMEQGYERMRLAQIEAKTAGWAALPETSIGYMPHRLSGHALRNMTQNQRRAFHSALVDQFVEVEGWDIQFADTLATRYLDRADRRALGGYDVPANVHHTGAADIVRDALEAMGMSREEVRAQMQRYRRGAAGHTKKRLALDLRKEYDDGAGGTFTLIDLFEVDQVNLLRQQAQRVSGEVALARHGIMGRPGLELMKRGMQLGDTGTKAQPKELEAFDQVAAELLGDPFGNHAGKWRDRAMQATSLSRLGGMGFTQFAEYINAATGIGVGRTLQSIASFGRLRQEILDLAAGKKVDNPILGSIEDFTGAQFGTDAYKVVMPYDNPDLQYQVNGRETTHFADKLLRGGLHVQGKLSGWRAIHSVQQRGVAEQIVNKAVQYIRAGTDDVALRDMGFTPEVAAAIRTELNDAAKFNAAGQLVEFDITKVRNKDAAYEFVQAVHRGANQLIQGTFIGETGKWAHEGWLRMLTQFRTFSITAIEKQWGRQRAVRGTTAALGILLGSMAVAAPIYMARMYVQSLGRPDQQEWLEKRLEPSAIARATLNYVALSGLSGDFLDAFSSVTGVGKVTGGRAGGTTEFVGTVVAPAAGLLDDVWRGVQNAKDGTDPHELAKALPFSKLPFLAPAINALGD